MFPLLAVAALAAHAAAEPRAFVVEPPPGWEDATALATSTDVIVQLRGPESSSFVLLSAPALELNNRAAVRSYLVQVLDDLKRRSGVEFGPASGLVETRFENGTTLLHVKASLQNRPRLVLGVARSGGRTALATLISNVPDTLLPSIMGTLRAGSAVAERRPGSSSSDDQLRFSLPAGASLRELTERERKAGFVAAVVGEDSEIMILKVLEEDAGASRDQSRIVRETVLSFPDVDAATLVPVAALPTPAGPELIYASAAARGPSDGARVMAGFLPWGYWGYSVLGKGRAPVELARATFAALSLGSSAQPKLVASSPRLSTDSSPGPRLPVSAKWAALGALAIVTVLAYKLLS
jgi:hypothetical protein